MFCDPSGIFYWMKLWFRNGSIVLSSTDLLLPFSTFDWVWANASNPVCVCLEKQTLSTGQKPSSSVNSQIIICSRVGCSQTYQSLMSYFFLLDDMSNKLKKLLKERELLSLFWIAAVFSPLSIQIMITCIFAVLGNWFHCLFRLLVYFGE